MGKYDRAMRKCTKFYNKPMKEELYNLDLSIISFLIPRLEKFIDDSSVIVDWNQHKEEGTDVIKTIEIILYKLRYIKNHLYDLDRKKAYMCDKYAKEAFSELGNILYYLWW